MKKFLNWLGRSLDFGRFFNKYSTDGDFQQRVLETKRPGITAASAWGWLVEEYPLLVDFIGGMATLFPGTATVEADFSTISLNKGTFRQSLSDLSLEGILHAKQIEEITLLDDIFAMMKWIMQTWVRCQLHIYIYIYNDRLFITSISFVSLAPERSVCPSPGKMGSTRM